METVALASLRLDGGTQPRSILNKTWVRDYGEDMIGGADFPAIVVFYDGTDHWLADGFHRTEAAKALGLETIAADIRQGSLRDAILYSVGANATHGQRRTNQDKRRAVFRLLEDPEWGGWSDREIARRCGVSDPFVGSLRPVAVSANDLQIDEAEASPPETRTARRKGKTYQQRRKAKPATAAQPTESAAGSPAAESPAAETQAGPAAAEPEAERDISQEAQDEPAPAAEPASEPESEAPPPFDHEAAELRRQVIGAIEMLAGAEPPRAVMDAVNKHTGYGPDPALVSLAARWLSEFAAIYEVEEPIRMVAVRAFVEAARGA